MSTGTTESAIASYASKVAYTGASVGILGGLSSEFVAAIGGLLIGVLGLAVNVYYRRKADRRTAATTAAAEQRAVDEHVARMALLARGIDPHGE